MIVRLPVPPVGVNVPPDPTLTIQGAGTGVRCDTIKVLPAIVMVPRRGLGPGLTPTLYATAPLPLPGLPLLMVTHGTLLTAVQTHPVGTETVTFGALPPAETVT